jgi:hypothetical protein
MGKDGVCCHLWRFCIGRLFGPSLPQWVSDCDQICDIRVVPSMFAVVGVLNDAVFVDNERAGQHFGIPNGFPY